MLWVLHPDTVSTNPPYRFQRQDELILIAGTKPALWQVHLGAAEHISVPVSHSCPSGTFLEAS